MRWRGGVTIGGTEQNVNVSHATFKINPIMSGLLNHNIVEGKGGGGRQSPVTPYKFHPWPSVAY